MPAAGEAEPTDASPVEVEPALPEEAIEPVPSAELPDTPPMPPPSPPSRGRGLLIAAAAVGTVGGIVRIATSVQVFRAIGLVRTGQAEADLPLAIAMQGAVFHAPMIATALGLAAGGMARRGRFEAHNEMFEGQPARRSRRKRLGWGLFGGGVAVWTVTRFAGLLGCRDTVCAARVWETGYYLSLAGTVPGAVMGGYASGFEGYQNRFGNVANVSLAPIAHRDSWGLALSGRF